MKRSELDTFPKLLLEHARIRPNRPANREKDYGIWQSWTWAEVAAEVEALLREAYASPPEVVKLATELVRDAQ